MADTLTEEEHIARAMLLGMRYHAGNGEPFYYEQDEQWGTITKMIDANTLEPMENVNDHRKVKQRDIDKRRTITMLEVEHRTKDNPTVRWVASKLRQKWEL